MAVDKQYLSLMPTPYPGVLATVRSALWTSCGWLLGLSRIIRHLPSTAKHIFNYLLLRTVRSISPRRGPGLPVIFAARAGRLPSRLHGRWDRAIIRW